MGLFGRDSQPKIHAPAQPQRSPLPAPQTASSTTIAEGSKVSGDITGSADIRIEGRFNGSVSVSGVVVIAESGRVSTSIRAARVSVSGKVDGDIFGEQMIELESTAVVTGDLLAPKILIREGASLQGRVEMASPPPISAASTEPKAKSKSGGHKGRKQDNRATPAESGTDENQGPRSQ